MVLGVSLGVCYVMGDEADGELWCNVYHGSVMSCRYTSDQTLCKVYSVVCRRISFLFFFILVP